MTIHRQLNDDNHEKKLRQHLMAQGYSQSFIDAEIMNIKNKRFCTKSQKEIDDDRKHKSKHDDVIDMIIGKRY